MICSRTIASVCFFCVLTTSALHGQAPVIFDSTDDQALALALRAIKMGEHDLSFSKTNVESELVLAKTRQFLQDPLSMPAWAQSTLTNLVAISSLAELVAVARDTLEVPAPPIAYRAPTQELPAEFLSRLPASLATVVQKIYARATFSLTLIRQASPVNKQAAWNAFALEMLQIDKDKAELENWERRGLDTAGLRELIRRGDALELQDTELADAILAASDKFYPATMMVAFQTLAGVVDETIASLREEKFTEEFEIATDSPLGKIIIGGAGRNIYTNEAFLIIDTGGDDIYENSAAGANGLTDRPIAIVIDCAGNDQYISRQSCAQGAGLFGIGILADLSGDDFYAAKHLSQGAGFFGFGLLADYTGHDQFAGDLVCQGAAMFGGGILWQRGGDSRYEARQLSQGLGGTRGVGILLDAGGNDLYFAGGKYPCPWLPGQYFSLSQGFGYGMRPYAGGGVGVLADLTGDDHYVADVYGQGASYWYATGLLLDAAGNDSYQSYQYSQGAGVHLSNGLLIDLAGDDQYGAQAICQGGAHDYSVGLLIDRAGNDRYAAVSTAQGSAINNSFAMLLDRAGDDFYAGRDAKQSQAAGQDGGKREYGSIAVLLDLAGKDVYSQGQTNDAVWLKPWYGAGVDYEAKDVGAPFRARPGDAATTTSRPEGRSYKISAVDTQHPIERLLRVAMSDRPDASEAWDKLKEQGTNALVHLVTRLDSPNVLVRVKAEELIDFLGTNSIPTLIDGIATAKNDEVARLCCYFLARFDEKARAAIPQVLPLLEREKTRTVAFYTLGHLRGREVLRPAMAALGEGNELVRLRAAQALGRIGERSATGPLITALDDELWTVRYAAEDALVALGRRSVAPLRRAFVKASPRARPHIIEALARLRDSRARVLVKTFYQNEDPLVRRAAEKNIRENLQTRHE